MKVYDWNEITKQEIKENGIKAIIFDLDNTLIIPNTKRIPKSIKEKISEFSEDFCIVVVSNSRKLKNQSYKKQLEKSLGVKIIQAKIPKPIKRSFEKACKLLEECYKNRFQTKKTKKTKVTIDKKEVLVIGDRFITDYLGAKLMGLRALLIKPLTKNEQVYVRFMRKIENFIIKLL